jgi:hypothetical protein
MKREKAVHVDTISAKDWPAWATLALQGLSYWIGHRQSLYGSYPLSEGALVAELCNLISANLPHTERLECEVMYSTLLNETSPPEGVLTEKSRADLVIRRAINGKPRFVVEVKRSAAGNEQINNDLKRLAEIRRRLPTVRSYFFLISEGVRPQRFVSANGGSIKGVQEIPESQGHFRTRCTLKAIPIFSNPDIGQYCCLIEVFASTKSVFSKGHGTKITNMASASLA